MKNQRFQVIYRPLKTHFGKKLDAPMQFPRNYRLLPEGPSLKRIGDVTITHRNMAAATFALHVSTEKVLS